MAKKSPLSWRERNESTEVKPSSEDAFTLQAGLEYHPTVSQYIADWFKRVRSGESGFLPVLGGLVLIVVIFQIESPVFLSPGNLTNLLVQSSVFILLAMAEIFVLLLGEIDLSIGYVAGVGAVVMSMVVGYPYHQSWWVGILAALAVTTGIGALQGTLVTKLNLPSFVVTLAGLLGWEGVMIAIVNSDPGATGGTIRISNAVITNLVNGNLSPLAGWVGLAIVSIIFGGFIYYQDFTRRRHGLTVAPAMVTLFKIGLMVIAGIALVAICNTNRGVLVPVEGVPWVIPIVLGFLVVWSLLLGRTRFGRYIYAIGGNKEAARRAGINVGRIRTLAFALDGFTAGAAGIIYASRLGSISINIDGGTLVLFAVASAVIGGTSLFGGRGKMIDAVLGGVVIATIYNGMGLLGLGAADQYMITALVLISAVIIDAVARRSRALA